MGKWKGDKGNIFSYDQSQRQKLLGYADLLRAYPITFDTMTLGKVELFIDTHTFDKDQQKSLIIELFQIAIVSLFFIFVLFYMIKRALFEPMRKLEVAHKTFESMTEAIVFTDGNGVIYESNNAFEHLSEMLSEQVSGQNINAFFPRISEQIARLIEHENEHGLWQGEADFQSGNAHVIPTWLSISLVKTSSNKEAFRSELVFVFQDISERKDAEQKLQKLAFYDALTAQPNRQYFEEELSTNLRLAHRQNTKLFLIFLDLDNFKHINDALGHEAGDQVLIESAKRLKRRLRETDFLSRIGGDEFTIIINGATDSEQVAELAQSLITAISQPIVISDSEFKVGASLGIAIYPDDASNAQDLIKRADIAMYNAKDLGKNQLSFFSTDLNHKVEHYFELRNSIDLAIRNEEFQLFYQPKVDLFTNKLQSAEGLIRWNTPNGELMTPNSFIPLAEETRQIIPIGQWVIETAVQQLTQWQSTRFREISLSINVSPIQFYSDDFIGHLQATLAKSAIKPSLLEIEITESAIISDTEKAIAILYELKDIGVKLSLDDFGTGYSSLSYLQRLPVDILKIDRSFIIGAKQGNVSSKILATIISLAQELFIDVVAEGIEDEENLALLKSHNCRLGQGYYFSRPLPIEQFEDLNIPINDVSNKV